MGADAPKEMATPAISFHEIPAKNNTAIPDVAIRIEVPKSGCLAIKKVGIAINNVAKSMCLKEGGNCLSDKYQAIIIGVANLSNSEGWKRTKPRFNHRCAPFPTSPKNSTPINSKTPNINNHGDSIFNMCGGTCAINNMAINAIAKRIAWRLISPRSSCPALINMTIPTDERRSNKKSNSASIWIR